jgi:hypothetical protein
MSSISGYYTGSPETDMESDLADLRIVKTSAEFTAMLESKISSVFTNDFFNITLVNALATSASRNPAWFGYCASLNVLDAKVLFSTLHISKLFNPAAIGTKNAIEKHHLFPKGYLSKLGITDDRDRNQNANFAFVEWKDNMEILDKSPAEYIKDQLNDIPAADEANILELHALPDDWENMDYFEFLKQRRILMARVIRKGFEQL